MTRKVHTRKSREIVAYSFFWEISRLRHHHAMNASSGWVQYCLSSLVFTAFTLEAFCNHLGERLFPHWQEFERLGPTGKLHLLCDRLDIKPDFGSRPFQTVPTLVGFRNRVSHGKSEVLVEEAIVDADRVHEFMFDWPQAKWEQYATRENSVRAREDVEAIVTSMLHASELQDEIPFHEAGMDGNASLMKDVNNEVHDRFDSQRVSVS